MGLAVNEIYFMETVPNWNTISVKFEELTGLKIRIELGVHLVNLTSDYDEIIEGLKSDYEKFNSLKLQDFDYDHEEYQKELRKLNYLYQLKINNPRFYSIDINIRDKCLELEYGIGSNYFIESLTRTLLELGGRFHDQKDEEIEYNRKDIRWRKLKKWSEYKWFNRPSK